MKKKGIGKGVNTPQKTCSDKRCPFHGAIGVRGRILTGIVTSDKMTRTVNVSWTRRIYVAKYERYEKRVSSVKAHNPDCINAKKGDAVKIAETKPLSKTKTFVVIEILGSQSKEQAVKEGLVQESFKEPVADKSKTSTEDESFGAGAEVKKKKIKSEDEDSEDKE